MTGKKSFENYKRHIKEAEEEERRRIEQATCDHAKTVSLVLEAWGEDKNIHGSTYSVIMRWVKTSDANKCYATRLSEILIDEISRISDPLFTEYIREVFLNPLSYATNDAGAIIDNYFGDDNHPCAGITSFFLVYEMFVRELADFYSNDDELI